MAALLSLPLGGLPRVDQEASPFDYTRVTKGGKYIFVMLSPKEQRQYNYEYATFSDPSSYDYKTTKGKLFNIFPSSGLYINDGSKKPLWTVDWYSFNAWPCSDGNHLVRWGPWARSGDEGHTLAVAFYRDGKEAKRYRVVDLIAYYRDLPSSVSHYRWAKDMSFDDVGKRVRLQLHGSYVYDTPGKTLMFDIVSGSYKVVK